MSYISLPTTKNASLGRNIALLITISLIGAGCWMFRSSMPKTTESVAPCTEPIVIPGLLLSFPTPQTRLDETNNLAVYMATESGKIESAWYGSTRTRKFGKLFLPAFHEGVDIAPTEHDSKGRAKDPVFAVADGCVGYISRVAGNSSYGIYVVLIHKDTLGEYYTLYAHLASADIGLKEGDTVSRGAEIGRMGNTSTFGIPVQRSHLHFEFGTILNDRFGDWFLSKKLKPFHGNLHGYNLAGLNPMELFPCMTNGQYFVLQQYITNCPVAFRLIVSASEKLDYYKRYPSLWVGDEPFEAIVVDVSESKVPLQARAATEEEAASLQKHKARVLEAFPEVLSRNGARLIIEKDGQWILGHNGEQWLEILLHR
jgi:murein DD-endopeptidase MepM/ murein hydrolase activator NlpD